MKLNREFGDLRVAPVRYFVDQVVRERPFGWQWLNLTHSWSNRDSGFLPEEWNDLGPILDAFHPQD